MTQNAGNAVRGSIGFGIGTLVATSLSFLGFPVVGLMLGGAIAGAFLTWNRGDFRLILVAAVGVDLGVLLGGFVVLMSLGVLAYGMEDVSGPPTLSVLLGFYSVFILGFAVAGASISAITVSRLVSLLGSVRAFAAGGVIGGAIIIVAEAHEGCDRRGSLRVSDDLSYCRGRIVRRSSELIRRSFIVNP